jgi:hypothetical protein
MLHIGDRRRSSPCQHPPCRTQLARCLSYLVGSFRCQRPGSLSACFRSNAGVKLFVPSAVLVLPIPARVPNRRTHAFARTNRFDAHQRTAPSGNDHRFTPLRNLLAYFREFGFRLEQTYRNHGYIMARFALSKTTKVMRNDFASSAEIPKWRIAFWGALAVGAFAWVAHALGDRGIMWAGVVGVPVLIALMLGIVRLGRPVDEEAYRAPDLGLCDLAGATINVASPRRQHFSMRTAPTASISGTARLRPGESSQSLLDGGGQIQEKHGSAVTFMAVAGAGDNDAVTLDFFGG